MNSLVNNFYNYSKKTYGKISWIKNVIEAKNLRRYVVLKVIKSNVEARSVSVVDDAKNVSLFTTDQVHCNAIYLKQHENYSGTTTEENSVILSTFQGAGELQVKDGDDRLSLQIMSSDIFSIPSNTSYTILNTGQDCLMISETIIKN